MCVSVLLPLNVCVISSSLYAPIAQQNEIIIVAIPTNDFKVNAPSLSIHTAILKLENLANDPTFWECGIVFFCKNKGMLLHMIR